MIQAIRDWFQLGLFEDEPPRDAAALEKRLRRLGLGTRHRVRLTRNRTVVVSHGHGELRIHESFLNAPEDVWKAVIAFVHARKRDVRHEAKRKILAFPVSLDQDLVSRHRKPEKTHPGDEALAAELAKWHAEYNRDRFDGSLKEIPIRISRRMRRRLGHYTPGTERGGPEIAISRRHIRRDGWPEALHTLVHEMVHQWQDETGREINHLREFRAKARDVGITPAACRAVA